MSPLKPAILVVEDDDNDVFFLKYAFETAGITNPIHAVSDGVKAMEYLSGDGLYADRSTYPMPGLVLMDLKLPVRMGLDVLRWIRHQPALSTLLVIVLSSSADPGDVDESYRLGARSFIVKPLSVDKRLEMVQTLKLYWLEMNQFPSLTMT